MKKLTQIATKLAILIACLGMGLSVNAQIGKSIKMLVEGVNSYNYNKYYKSWNFSGDASMGSARLFMAYSQVNNKYEDDNLRAELIGSSLYVWNKTDQPLYINNRSSFMYLNDRDVCFYVGTETKSGDVTYIEQEVKAIAPKANRVLVKNFTNPYGGIKLSAQSANLSDNTIDYMGYMESLRSDLANAPDKTSSSVHFEQDESFLTVKAAINYSTDAKLDNSQSFMVSTWVSDMILAKVYFDRRNNNQKKSNSVSVRGRAKEVLHVFAEAPFEYDEDSSPIEHAQINFGKGEFSTSYFNIDDGALSSVLDKDGFGDVSSAKRSDATFVWEGHSSDFETSVYDLILKCQLNDGASLKDAEKAAKKLSKEHVKEMTFKK